MKKLILAIFVTFAMLNCGSAFADSITGVVTGDDNISYWTGSSWEALGTTWPTAETLNLTINQSSENVYFAVSNNKWYPGGDPAGFLASFTDNNGNFEQTGTNTLVSNPTTVKILPSIPWTLHPGPFGSLNQINPPNFVNPSLFPKGWWQKPVSYGANGGSQIWNTALSGPVPGVDPNADWLWTKYNDGTYQTQTDYAFFEINLGVIPTPEAPTLLLFALAGIMVALFYRRKMLNVA